MNIFEAIKDNPDCQLYLSSGESKSDSQEFTDEVNNPQSLCSSDTDDQAPAVTFPPFPSLNGGPSCLICKFLEISHNNFCAVDKANPVKLAWLNRCEQFQEKMISSPDASLDELTDEHGPSNIESFGCVSCPNHILSWCRGVQQDHYFNIACLRACPGRKEVDTSMPSETMN